MNNVRSRVGHFRDVGVLNLSHQEQKYCLKEGVVSFNLDKKLGVGAPMQYADGVLHLNLDEKPGVGPMDEVDVGEHIVGLIMAHQYALKKGLELFGDKDEEADVKELKQIHDMDTYMPMNPKTLSIEEKNKALSVLFFLTEKRDGKINGRKCAVWNKQRTYRYKGYNKADGTSPTVSTDGLLITAIINGHVMYAL